MSFEDRLAEFRRQLISEAIYSRLPGKNEETLAMISLYRFGSSNARLEAKRWLQKVMEGVVK
ncbi:Uncharacterised protein [Streptococcus suis]|uniref:Uncharacterized protein n=1 Tax=Streptococcus suis TaxID=1307 RepID=A0A0Z8AVI4_STRSU|nr:Uncharacterised protein [Streptococcus suis]CYU69265.1 Uncharacterised protein [Streptococcus suis]CYV12429.1 Uncharacterised protein [Streptococcus suis]CYW02163.1 Uncharacterised protein [Streptococcus suis]CYX35897.1 Uncharacterised protein [Streptococcus suis]